MKVVLDTNVLVSALLTPHGAPGRVIDLILGGEVVTCFDDRILAEYREVLARPVFGFGADGIEAVLEYLEHEGLPVVAKPLRLPDPDDRMFLEVAVAAKAEWLITGNLRHFPARERRGVRVVTPREFVDRWTST